MKLRFSRCALLGHPGARSLESWGLGWGRLTESLNRGPKTSAGRSHAQLQICSESSPVDVFIEALQQTSYWYSEDFADPEQGSHGDRSPSFDLLPVSRGEAERDHV